MKSNDPIFWPTDEIDQSLRQSMQKNYTDSINILQTQWSQADIDERYAMGDQDIWGLVFPQGVGTRRKMFNFNIINPIIQAVSGQQRQNRKSLTAVPILHQNQQTADQMTKCLYYIHNRGGVHQTYSNAFEQGALVQGLGFLSIFKDMTDDPVSGDISVRYVDMKSCLFDPYFRNADLSDCRYWWTRQFFDKNEAATLYPHLADDILSLPRGTYRDDKFYYMPEVYQIQFPNLIAFDEYWYMSTRSANYIVDVETEEVQEFDGDEEDFREKLSKVDRQFRRRLKLIEKPRQTVRRCIVVNDKVMLDEQNPYGLDRYPVVPVLGYFNPNTPYYAYKFRGMVRDMRDTQFLFTRRKVADLDILESQQQGIKMKKGSLVTPDDSLNTGNGRVLVLDKNASMDDVQQMDIHPPSPVMLQMEEMLLSIAHKIAGIDPSAMGIDVDDKAGIISMMRQAATARNLQRLFDQLDASMQQCGDIMIRMIQKNWTVGKVKQVCGEEPTAEFYDKLFYKYGTKVVQGALTETQQQLNLAQLIYIKKDLGIDVPSEVIIGELTVQNKDKLTEAIKQREQAAMQQQQKMEQLQMQQLAIANESELSYARSQDGLAAERKAKIQTDIAVAKEKLSRSQEESSANTLNLLKAVKELQGMDLNRMQQQLEMVLAIEESQRPVEINSNNQV